jgi:hypothetical protein
VNKNVKNLGWALLWFPILFLFFACDDSAEEAPELSLIANEINGASLSNLDQKVALNTVLNLNFSVAINPQAFENKLELRPANEINELNITYSNASSKVSIALVLNEKTAYTLNIAAGEIGARGEVLKMPIVFGFETVAEAEVITSTAPCISASNNCLQTRTFVGTDGQNGSIEYYSNYPLYPEDARWEDLENAIIVVHGANRNYGDYYSWVGSTMRSAGLEGKTILISPQFKNESEASDDNLFWDSNNWREGETSKNPMSISSFSVIDSLANQLANKAIFPNLKKVIITGHSSGGLFTHVYGAANRAETNLGNQLDFEYLVANSQYFYYPDGQRVNTSSGELYSPTSCNSAQYWPLGFNLVPDYVNNVGLEVLNQQFQERKIYYFLGNGTASDGAFNDGNCAYQLLGDSRFNRGANMFDYMGLKYASHGHQKFIVEGIGHNGQGMYGSSEFSGLLLSLLN